MIKETLFPASHLVLNIHGYILSFFQQCCLSFVFGWPKCKHLKADQLNTLGWQRFERYSTAKDLRRTPRSTLDLTELLKQGAQFPTDF